MANKYHSDVMPNRGDKNTDKCADYPKGKSKPAGDPSFKQHPKKSGGPKP